MLSSELLLENRMKQRLLVAASCSAINPPQLRSTVACRYDRSAPCSFFCFTMMHYWQRSTRGIPQNQSVMWHCCESVVLSKRPTLVFCSNVSHWRVCAYRKCAIITLHPDFAFFDSISKSTMRRTRQLKCEPKV